MAKRDFEFDETRKRSITRYTVWTVVACIALVAFLYRDDAFDDLIDETATAPFTTTVVG